MSSLSPIFAFFSQSPPASPTQSSGAAPKHKPSHKRSTSVTLFTHQDGKKFEVAIVRLDDNAPVASVNAGGYDHNEDAARGDTAATNPREEDWDSDDWDEDAEDLDSTLSRLPQMAAEAAQAAEVNADRSRAKGEERSSVDDWDGDTEDLEEPPVAAWAERLERPESMRRQRDADAWRTRLAEY